MIHFAIPIYQRREGAWVEWTTLGLGPYTRTRRDRHASRVHEALVHELRELVASLPPGELSAFQLARGTQLERVRVELSLRPSQGGGRKKVSGLCPLVLEPRWASEDRRIVIVYHPARQAEWFPLREGKPLAAQAQAFLQARWAELPEPNFASLFTNGKDLIRIVSFTKAPRPLDATAPGPARPPRASPLAELGVDLTRRAAEGLLELGRPRPPLRERLRALLGASPRASAVVVGPPGVGKTTLVRRAVADLLAGDDFDSHRSLDRVRHVVEIAGQRLIAGMSRHGEWERRCVDLLDEARALRAILFVPDLHLWGRLGKSRDSDRSLADVLRGPVARGEITIVGECTAEQLAELEEDAPSFAQRLGRLRVPEASAEETVHMLLHEARALEERHRVTLEAGALRAIVEAGTTLLPFPELPGRVLDLLRRVVRARSGAADARGVIAPPDVLAALAARTGMPPALLDRAPLDAATVVRALEARVKGQPEAVAAAADLVLRVKARMTDPRRPYGVYLFAGPTGTGKTELARALAEQLFGSEARLIRLDMGEFVDASSASRLIGDRSAPEGWLTARVREQPHAVVLLDEIEKAHPEVHGLLLQLFDEGRLTDAAGDTASFTSTVVVMTSNLGARSRAPLGFGDEDGAAVARGHVRAVREFFAPELFNRIDRVVPFLPITRAVAAAIAEKELGKLLGRRGLLDRQVFVTAEPGVVQRVVREAFDQEGGARSLLAWLEDHIGTRLTEHLVEGPRASMQIARLVDADGSIDVVADTLTEREPVAASFPLEADRALPLPQLLSRAREALSFLDRIEAGPELATLSADIREHLRRHERGDKASADALFNLEAMRAELKDFRGRLADLLAVEQSDDAYDVETSARGAAKRRPFRLFDRRSGDDGPPRTVRAHVLEALAEAAFLSRALSRVREPDQHAIAIEISQPTAAGGARAAGEPFAAKLAAVYEAARGTCEDRASRDGRLVLVVVGLCVRDFFELESGYHVLSSLGAPPEIARVRVFPAPSGARAEELCAAPSPPDSPGPKPLVRRIHFEPPRAGGAMARLDLEDYAMGTALSLTTRDLAGALHHLFLIRMSRQGPGA